MKGTIQERSSLSNMSYLIRVTPKQSYLRFDGFEGLEGGRAMGGLGLGGRSFGGGL